MVEVKFIKVHSLIIFFFISLITAQAQFPVIEFEENNFDFGQIKEESGPVIHEFKFSNKGDAPLVIKDVQASCGCTTPFFTKESIAPGKKGSIKAQYDPFNRPGVFDKTLTITSNADPATNFLKIKGFVIARVRTIADDYPDTVGNLRMPSRFMNVGSVSTKEVVVREFKVYNEGNAAITFQNPNGLPSHLKLEITPKVVPSKGTAVFKISYDAKAKNDFGYLFDNFILPTNDKKNPKKELSVVAIVSEDFSHLSLEDKQNAPKITLTQKEIDLGTVNSDDRAQATFEVLNTGKSDLMLRKVKSTCRCIEVTPEISVVKPNQSTKINVVFDTKGRKGQELKNVYIYSNDFSNPELVIDLKINITPKP